MTILRRWKIALVCCALCLATASVARAQRDVSTKKTFLMPMRDGVKLATNIYLPDGKGPWPIVLTRTPYNKNGTDRSATQYTSRGYALVSQDVRGRYDSEGVNVPFENDIADGYDTVEFLAVQDYSNAKIGIFGTSAPGITSNLAAAAAPPHLTAAFVTVAPDSSYYRSRFVGGAFKESHAGGWLRGQGISEDQIAEYRRRAVLDQRTKDTDFVFFRDKVQIPIYNIGGWHDIYSEGTAYNFVYLQNEGRPGARGNQKLFMGAFGHGNLVGDLQYPGGGSLGGDLTEQMRWWDYWLKGIDNGIMNEPRVSYYLMAAARKGDPSPKNRLIKADSWPPKSTKTRYYLHQGGTVSAQPPSESVASQTYAFDPANPVPTVGGHNLSRDVGPRDQREIQPRGDYLRFATSPLESDIVVAGHIDMELWVATDCADTDFVVKLVDVYPDGYEALILDYPLRTRFRHGREAADVRLMTPGQAEKLTIDLWSTANTFEKGHRLALHVTSSNYPRFDVNPNTGGPVGDASNPRVANNTIYFDSAHPSAVILPVVSELP